MAHKKKYLRTLGVAIYEGKLFTKIWKKIPSLWKKAWKRVDFFIGKIVRYFAMKRIKVNPKKIIFIPFQGDYTCNLKYITEELIRNEVDCEIVWAVRKATLRKSSLYSPQIKFVDQYTAEYYDDLASSAVWVVNSVDFLKRKVYKKKNQVLIQTWHGSLGIKRFDAAVNKGYLWVKAAEYCGKVADYCISNSLFENDVYTDTFWPNTEILEYGHPRNDILINNDDARCRAQERVRSKLGIAEDMKVVLYAPTFRDNHKFDMYLLDYERLTQSLSEKMGGDWVVLTRFHPTVRKYVRSRAALRGTINTTGYDDIQELMTIVDFAITDYSSWIYDFMLTRRPCLIFAMDLEDYYTERGFYYPLSSTPFPVCTDNDQVEAAIRDFDMDLYRTQVDEFLLEKGCWEDGHASERTANKIQEIINKKTIEASK